MTFLNLKERSRLNDFLIYLIYGTIIFLSAFLLFLIQPLISKYILPWFGGTASVWTVAMLFFQTALLLGYIYAHLISKYLKPLPQVILHLILLLVTLITLSILPSDSLKPLASDNPIFHILILLSLVVGLPAIILSATSPLIQNWIGKIKATKTPYRLYALSNAGSLIALIGFPFVFEPLYSIKAQLNFWSVLFFIFVLFFVFCAILFLKYSNYKSKISENNLERNTESKPSLKIKTWWLMLSACTSILLLAVTNKISQDFSVVPLFWVVPLSLYLLSFIIPFGSEAFVKWFSKNFFYFLLASAIVNFGLLLISGPLFLNLWPIITLLILLFLFSLVCHTELVKLKPGSQYVTNFYLMIALGGVLGAVLTGIIAPLIFNSYAELPLILLICIAISLKLFLKNEITWLHLLFVQKKILIRKSLYITLISIALYIILVGIAIILFFENFNPMITLAASRNFYGTLRVKEAKVGDLDNKQLLLFSGEIIHGSQFIKTEKHKIPTTYYGEKSGISLVFNYFSNKKIRIGAIGLGAGTLAAFGKKGDYIKFYEINPQVVDLNKKYFTYLKDSSADIEIILGDGRLSLEREEPQNFDIIVVDAFTGDSIPIHLLTKEAFEIYLKNLKPDGVIAVDISNKHLDLTPVLFKLAENFKLQSAIIIAYGNYDEGTTTSAWVLLSNNAQLLESQLIKSKESAEIVKVDNFKLWTDDYSNLLSVLRSTF